MSTALARALPEDADVLWRPNSPKQARFLASPAFEALYGGAAGGGKTDALLYGLTRQTAHPAYRGLFLRRTFPELREVMDRALFAFRRLGAEWRESEKRWRFPSGATIEFGYCETWRDVQRYQGQEFTAIAFDELGQIAEERVWTFLMSRCRSSAAGLVRQMRASANPGGAGHAWLKRRFIRDCPPDGTLHIDPATGLTRAFVAARLSDNPALLQNDPEYEARLRNLPDVLRRQLLEGDWTAGEGMALDELSRDQHLVPAFAVPGHWFQWGALDWGYRHPFVAGHFACDEDGTVYLVDSVWARGLLPDELAGRVQETIPVSALRFFVAGHDVWQDHKARGQHTPTVAEQFAQHGIALAKANIARVSGLNNLRRYVTWKNGAAPRFQIMDTPNNRRVFDVLESMVCDPDKPEDALKVDADDAGNGGDDAFDMVRYGLAARPLASKPMLPEINAFAPEVLQAEYERGHRVRHEPDPRDRKRMRRERATLIDENYGAF